MAKEKAVYEPGELDRVRNKLGVIDEDEAKRMAEVLGGDVGVERSASPPEPSKVAPIVRRKYSDTTTGPKTKGDATIVGNARSEKSASLKESLIAQKQASQTDDDPKVPVKANYFERLKMDRYAAEEEFEIKSFAQVIFATFSFFTRPTDYVNSAFITRCMPVYYKKIELLVNSTRTLFPRNNRVLNDKLKRISIFVFSVLDTIRYWNIERISGDLARMQARPHGIKISELSDILRAVYKPIFILEHLNTEAHIRESYKLLYRLLFIEDPINAKRKYEDLIENAMDAFISIRENIHYLLYPLLMKLLSSTFIPYERFFKERRNRFLAFLNATEEERINPVSPVQAEEEKAQDGEAEEVDDTVEGAVDDDEKARRKQAAAEAEQKTFNQSLRTMETLFPHAGWDKLDTYPDLYPYFRGIFNLKKDYELIAPTDALQQVIMLMRVLQELFFGLRYTSFSPLVVPQNGGRLDEVLGDIINNWPNHEIAFEKEYLSRLSEYCRLLESSDRTSTYTKRLYSELQWLRKLYFFPYYQFETFSSPPIPKNSINAVYPEVRRLRKLLSIVVSSIETANKNGGVETLAHCEGINNPWNAYTFQVGNPISMRLNMLLGPKRRTNATLVSFTLMVASVLDHILNCEDSWAYPPELGHLFRSVNGEGNIPQFGVDEKIDADLIFKQVLKEQREHKKQT
ncbi:MAG: hypothetical protein LBD79_09760 [Treponema sp.]|jgi:hypothetical protein|nr:hypothetical protein [Treponema sp.]